VDLTARIACTRGSNGRRPWTGAVDPVHWFTIDPLQTVKGYVIRVVGFTTYGGGRTHATGGGTRPAHGGARRRLRRKFAGDGDLGATVHHSRRKMDKEKEEDGAELTRGSMTAVGRCRRRAAKRGGRDHGRSPGR
jgi:hypothetical protein